MTTFNRVNDRIGFHFDEVKLCISSRVPKIQLQGHYLTLKKKPWRNKLLFFLKAKSEITFKPIARQKERERGKETEMRTKEHC